MGLDTAINEELPADLRTLDQMCFSPQFFFLGSLHASGIVMAVLGYMLVLHKGHNMCVHSISVCVWLCEGEEEGGLGMWEEECGVRKVEGWVWWRGGRGCEGGGVGDAEVSRVRVWRARVKRGCPV